MNIEVKLPRITLFSKALADTTFLHFILFQILHYDHEELQLFILN